MKNLMHFAAAAAAVLIAAVPAILASPATINFVQAHPAYAAYFPLAAGIIAALIHAAKNQVSPPKV